MRQLLRSCFGIRIGQTRDPLLLEKMERNGKGIIYILALLLILGATNSYLLYYAIKEACYVNWTTVSCVVLDVIIGTIIVFSIINVHFFHTPFFVSF